MMPPNKFFGIRFPPSQHPEGAIYFHAVDRLFGLDVSFSGSCEYHINDIPLHTYFHIFSPPLSDENVLKALYGISWVPKFHYEISWIKKLKNLWCFRYKGHPQRLHLEGHTYFIVLQNCQNITYLRSTVWKCSSAKQMSHKTFILS